MRLRVLTCAILVFASWGCSRNGDSSGPSMPTPTSGARNTMVNIMGQDGGQSFSPNPAPVGQGGVVVWHNMDSTVHRIVMNDGSFDSGDIGPGGNSAMMRLTSPGYYHCTIHPTTMFGSINLATDPAPSPGPSPY